jgi:uncharacterized membrane protein
MRDMVGLLSGEEAEVQLAELRVSDGHQALIVPVEIILGHQAAVKIALEVKADLILMILWLSV